MALLDVGGGAASGLETLLTRMREDELLKQRQQQIDETSRANKADESLKRFTAGQTMLLRGDAARSADAARTAGIEAKKFTEANQRQGEYTIGQDVPRTEASANIEAGLSPTLYQQPNVTTKSTVGVLPLMSAAASRMQDTNAQPQSAPIDLKSTTGTLTEPSPFLTYTGTGKERAAADKETRMATEQTARDARADATAALAERRANQTDRRLDTLAAATGSKANDPESIADAIISGDQPPVLTGLYRNAAPVRAALARKGYNLSGALTDWNATQRHLATLNGPQQTRLAQSIQTAADSLGVVEDLAKQWDGGQFPILNKAQLSLAVNGTLGPKAQQIATKLEAQITDVASEIANAYMGGNSPTDRALLLASKNLQADWNRDQLLSAIGLARTNLQIRLNSIKNSGVAGVGGTSQYAPKPDGNSIPVVSDPYQDYLKRTTKGGG